MQHHQPQPSLRERMHSIFVEHSVFEEALNEIEFYLDAYEPDGVAPPPCLPVVGPSGVGKSTLFRKLRDLYQPVKDARKIVRDDGCELTCDYVPLVCVTIPEKISTKDIAGEMLKQLGDPRWNKGSAAERANRIDLYLSYCGTKGVLFDESQRVLDRTGVLTSEEFADWIKERHSKGRSAFFLFGLPHITDLFDQDSQFDRRWLVGIEMLPYSWGDDNDKDLSGRDNFKGLLVSIRNKSPVPFAPELDIESDAGAKPFYYAGRGTAGHLKEKLLETAMFILMRRIRSSTRTTTDKPPTIDLELLSAAFKKAFRTKNERLINPFSSEWDGRLPPPIQHDNYLTAKARQRRKGQRKSDRKRYLEATLSKS
jgi:energy-coupling factor transporter ATP-binding protein EcfA2